MHKCFRTHLGQHSLFKLLNCCQLYRLVRLLTGKLMMNVDEISDHFWRETPWGKAMKEQLSNPTQRK